MFLFSCLILTFIFYFFYFLTSGYWIFYFLISYVLVSFFLFLIGMELFTIFILIVYVGGILILLLFIIFYFEPIKSFYSPKNTNLFSFFLIFFFIFFYIFLFIISYNFITDYFIFSSFSLYLKSYLNYINVILTLFRC